MLPSATETVWRFLSEQPVLTGFVLVGGSALALRIQHRRSEDLDFAFPGAQLPRVRLDALMRLATAAGFEFQRNDDEAAVQEFSAGGLELNDYQQNFLVNRAAKVSFFVPAEPLAKVLASAPEATVRVATLAELFKAKCLVSAVRSKTRDWLDLYLLMREHGFSIRDYQASFREAGLETQCDIGLSRLCSGVPQRDDEGYAHLLENTPSLEEIKAFFRAQRDRLEIESAAEESRKRPGGMAENG